MNETEDSSSVSDTGRGGAGPSHTPSFIVQASNNLFPGQCSTPNEIHRGLEARMQSASMIIPPATSGGISSMESKRGFSVTAGESGPNKKQRGDGVQRSPSVGPASLFGSTLNPDAKEFQLPGPQTNEAVGASLAPMWQFPPMYGAGSSVPVMSSAVPTAAAPWQATPWQAHSPGSTKPFTVSDPEAHAQRWPHASAHPTTLMPRDPKMSSIPLMPDLIARQVMDEYAEYCRENGYHVVSVSNLEPGTTQKDLLDIFFPMCACHAELLPRHRSPQPNRRAGLVFFPFKDPAMMAVKKFDWFVPHKQRKQLSVRYLGPDALEADAHSTSVASVNSTKPLTTIQQASQLTPESVGSTSQKIPRPHADLERDSMHKAMWKYVRNNKLYFSARGIKHVLAVHGLNALNAESVLQSVFVSKGAEGYDIWQMNASPSLSTTKSSEGVSALVRFTQESMAKLVMAWVQQQHQEEGQTHAMDVVHLNSLDFASEKSLNDTSEVHSAAHAATNGSLLTTASPSSNVIMAENIDALFPRKYDDPNAHLVAVDRSTPNTDHGTQASIFSLHGRAHGVAVHPTVAKLDGEPHGSGVAFLGNESTVREVVEKWDCSVPVTQPNLLKAPHLGEEESLRVMTPLDCASLYTGLAEDVTSGVVPGTKLNDMVVVVQNMLYTPALNDEKLMEQMRRVITHPATTKEVVEQLASVIDRTLTEMKHHAGTLATPLANALMLLHEKLNIPRNGTHDANVEEGVCDSNLGKYTDYMILIARTVINLFMDETKPPESRKVAAMLGGYLFQFSYLGEKTPYELSVGLMNKYKMALNDARDYVMRPHMNTTNSVTFLGQEGEDEKHKPWLTLLECLEELTSVWRQSNKSRAKKDPFRKEYERRLSEFSQAGMTRTGGGSSVTASTRPTPKRVVAKVVPGSAGGSLNRTPGLTCGSSVSSRVNPHSLGKYSGVSHDVSMDSNASLLAVLPDFSTTNSSLSPRMRMDGSTYMLATNLSPCQLQSPPIQRHDAPARGDLSDGVCFTGAVKPMPGWARANAGLTQYIYTHTELLERTVYITKLPSFLRRAQFRRLLLHFGEFNKVRLCRDDNQTQMKAEPVFAAAATTTTTTSNVAAPFSAVTAAAHGSEPPVLLYFSFVEFAEQSSARAMIEYFRNVVTNPQPFSFLRDISVALPESGHFTPQEIQGLLGVRASPARNPIHDQHSLDAVLVSDTNTPRQVLRKQPCLFGFDGAEKRSDASADADASAASVPSAVFENFAGGYVGGGDRKTEVAVLAASESLQWRPSATTEAQSLRFRSDAAEAPGQSDHDLNATPEMWLAKETWLTHEGDPLEGVSFIEGPAGPTPPTSVKVDSKDVLSPQLLSAIENLFRGNDDGCTS
ncbi:putative RNA-binding protein [Trypanosoma rangeli]|uniref:Putative RNA-binding protein n=1 Tax=Trypanosoma rangeli TaxID=5698 RepID=A0A3R7KH40_TRYRA|nr:putative RNA-binding protein [Trypanosoma rangeli]RNF07541.1 putative RNA-binding protein [Trypanosoma rangeli]|eukprot:RNF07541.1 putative RNA-binding protein [Trypanosoma rangeli]